MTQAPAGERTTLSDRRLLHGTVLLALLPVVLLLALLYVFATWGYRLIGPPPLPPDALGRLDIERVSFRPDGIAIQVVNSGPTDLTIAQVAINQALWHFSISPEPTVPRLRRATINVPYSWLAGEPHEVKIITSNGLTFTKLVPVAAPAPEPKPAFFLLFTLLGLYVGVFPIALGLLWFPVLRQLGQNAMDFVLALTVGLLIFLGLDTVKEALELAEQVAKPFRGFSLAGIGIVGSFLLLMAVSRRTVSAQSQRSDAQRQLALAYLIAISIGLHNLGEGLAIGAAYALGELALGALLVIGFTIHNTTEGPAIVAPVARQDAALHHLAALGLLAGGPTILGSWIGGFTYSSIWPVAFLAIGAGAIFQVILQLTRLPGREGSGWLLRPASLAGLLTGMVFMYATGLLVAV